MNTQLIESALGQIACDIAREHRTNFAEVTMRMSATRTTDAGEFRVYPTFWVTLAHGGQSDDCTNLGDAVGSALNALDEVKRLRRQGAALLKAADELEAQRK